jgi:glycosidase
VWSGSALTLRDYFNSGFDALFNFPLYFTLSGSNDQNGDGVLNGVNSPRLFDGAYLAMQRLYPRGAQLVQFPSNHDTNRIASDAEGDIRRMKLAAVLTFVSPGTPMIYYGEEIGMRGNKSDGNPYWDEYRREPMDWYARETGPGMTNWFKPPDRNNRPNDGVSVEEQENDPDSLLNFYRQMVKMRAAHPALARGDFRLIEFKDCETCFGLWRWAEGETIASVLNFGPRVQTTRLDVANAPVQIRGDAQFLLGGAGEVSALRLEPWGSVVVAWK